MTLCQCLTVPTSNTTVNGYDCCEMLEAQLQYRCAKIYRVERHYRKNVAEAVYRVKTRHGC